MHIYSTCPHITHIYSLTSERALQRVQDLLKSLVMAKGHLRQLGGVSEDDVQRENELQEHKRYQGTCSPLWILHKQFITDLLPPCTYVPSLSYSHS